MKNSEINILVDPIFAKLRHLVLLGMGREGESSYRFLKKYYPDIEIIIADKNQEIKSNPLFCQDQNIKFCLGSDYIEKLASETYDFVLKSPGVCLKNHKELLCDPRMSSQADVFMSVYSSRVVAVTGTKGKSTISSLIHHLLSQENSCLKAGNMGIPFLDIVQDIKNESFIVCEISCHQAQSLRSKPKYSVISNLFQEHLDYYNSYEEYMAAKMNMVGENLIFCADEKQLLEQVKKYVNPSTKLFAYTNKASVDGLNQDLAQFKNLEIKKLHFPQKSPLLGLHNTYNINAAYIATELVSCAKPSFEKLDKWLSSFEPLAHRMQYVGCFDGLHFFNDSISTIPQATIAAIESIKTMEFTLGVDTLILGGFDRGIDYEELVDYLVSNPIKNIIFVGTAGERIKTVLQNKGYCFEKFLQSDDYKEIVDFAKKHTKKDWACLLSPAAASYDSFKNFEERGNCFMEHVKA